MSCPTTRRDRSRYSSTTSKGHESCSAIPASSRGPSGPRSCCVAAATPGSVSTTLGDSSSLRDEPHARQLSPRHVDRDRASASCRPVEPAMIASEAPIRRLLFVADAAVAEVHDLPAEARALFSAAAEVYVVTPTLPGGSPGLPTMWISSATLRTSASTRCSPTCGPSAPTPRSAQPRQRPDGHRRCGRGLQARSHARAAERGARQLAGAWARGAPGEALRPATHQLRSGPARACHRRSTPIACPRRLRARGARGYVPIRDYAPIGDGRPPPWSHGMGPSIGCACPSSILPAYSRRLSTPAAADASRWSPRSKRK